MGVRVVALRRASGAYTEANPKGPTHWGKGQILKIVDEADPIGRHWRASSDARVIYITGAITKADLIDFLDAEYPDAIDESTWGVTFDDDNPAPLLRKRAKDLDIDDLETFVEGIIGRPLADDEEIVIPDTSISEVNNRKNSKPKTRWSKQQYDDNLKR